MLGHVKDLGNDPDDPSTRIYTTSAAQSYHTDSADIVGLLCINKAVKGGESQCVSSLSIWNELVAARPDLAAWMDKLAAAQHDHLRQLDEARHWVEGEA